MLILFREGQRCNPFNLSGIAVRIDSRLVS